MKAPSAVDNKKVFKDVIDLDGPFREIIRNQRNDDKINMRGDFSYELIGSYDRVGTLTTQYGCGNKAVGYGDWFRFLTTLECERLQGFSDGWTNGLKDQDRYFALGNAVNCKVSDYLFGEYLKGVWF